ncbi:helix-turn-helix transcriptional regulator [Psychromonas arctica]|uniref:helix-turn-helix transcriptional regulator n=1 Tax=Psychromonas arctica TaxID=168275 RepID=UPI00048F354C|nr:AlpA family phage regulatory protein [Psychromonas arctica]
MIQQSTFSQSNRIISITELSDLLSKSRVSLWRYERDGILPKPIKVQGRTLGWRESVILEWLETQEVA